MTLGTKFHSTPIDVAESGRRKSTLHLSLPATTSVTTQDVHLFWRVQTRRRTDKTNKWPESGVSLLTAGCSMTDLAAAATTASQRDEAAFHTSFGGMASAYPRTRAQAMLCIEQRETRIGHIDQCIYILSPNKSQEGRNNFDAYSPSNLDVGTILGTGLIRPSCSVELGLLRL